jgi:hypothetical protein
MIWSKNNKEAGRYYLFAGMGGKPARRKHKVFLAWSLVAGALISSLLGLIFYFLNVYYR